MMIIRARNTKKSFQSRTKTDVWRFVILSFALCTQRQTEDRLLTVTAKVVHHNSFRWFQFNVSSLVVLAVVVGAIIWTPNVDVFFLWKLEPQRRRSTFIISSFSSIVIEMCDPDLSHLVDAARRNANESHRYSEHSRKVGRGTCSYWNATLRTSGDGQKKFKCQRLIFHAFLYWFNVEVNLLESKINYFDILRPFSFQ